MSTIVAFPEPHAEHDLWAADAAWLDPSLDVTGAPAAAAQFFLDVALDPDAAPTQRCEVASYLAATFGGSELSQAAWARLDAPAAVERRVAALLLGSPGNLRAIFPLVALLDDPVLEVRRAAVWALAGIRDHRVLSFLLGVLDRDDALVITTLAALKLFPLSITREIFDAYLRHDDREVSLAALGAFSLAPEADVVDRALPFLSHPDPRHRCLALTIVERCGRRRHLEPLFPLLGDPVARVRRLAHEVVASIRGTR